MAKILIIDDSEEILEIVANSLEFQKTVVETATTVQSALAKVSKETFDLLIIDIGLPDGDGFDLFTKIRAMPRFTQVPVIFLTSKEDVVSKVSAFALGADDYIVKPFHVLELRARVESQLRKYISNKKESDRVVSGPFILDIRSQRLKVRGESGYISLTPKEFKIFLLLVRNSDRIFSRENILNRIMGDDVHVTVRTIDAHICYLRKKLGRYSAFVESVAGEGYRFNPSHPVDVVLSVGLEKASPVAKEFRLSS